MGITHFVLTIYSVIYQRVWKYVYSCSLWVFVVAWLLSESSNHALDVFHMGGCCQASLQGVSSLTQVYACSLPKLKLEMTPSYPSCCCDVKAQWKTNKKKQCSLWCDNMLHTRAKTRLLNQMSKLVEIDIVLVDKWSRSHLDVNNKESTFGL